MTRSKTSAAAASSGARQDKAVQTEEEVSSSVIANKRVTEESSDDDKSYDPDDESESSEESESSDSEEESSDATTEEEEDEDEEQAEIFYTIYTKPISSSCGKRKRGRTTERTTTQRKRRGDEESESENEDNMLKKYYDHDDIKYYKKLDKNKKKRITEIEKKVHMINASSMPIRFKILESDMDIYVKSVALAKVDQLAVMDPSNGEHSKITNWVENLCKLPIGKYKQLPVTCENSVEDISLFLDSIQERLDKAVYGHIETKNQIIRMLAKWIANKNSKGLVIGLQGKAGVGKTSIAMEICECLGLPFGFISLSGISTSEMLKGFQFTYEGSRHGAIVDVLMKAGVMNPIMFFDELDKVSTTRAGEEVINSLIHMTDHSQNHKFQDRYFADIDLDLSKCLMIFSYNHEELINPILRDRMIKINIDGYKINDKVRIAQDFLLPKAMTEFAFSKGDIVFEDDVIKHLIDQVDTEDGVRNLKRGLEEIVSQLNLHRLLKKEITKGKLVTLPFKVDRELVDMFIKKKKDGNELHSMMYL